MEKDKIDLFGYVGIALFLVSVFILLIINEITNPLYLGVVLMGNTIYFAIFIYYLLPSEEPRSYNRSKRAPSYRSKTSSKQEKKQIPLSGKCRYCNKKTIMPYRCKYCGDLYCSEHRLPEKHNCDGTFRRHK